MTAPNLASSTRETTDNSDQTSARWRGQRIESPLEGGEVMQRLEKRARQGKLPGFEKRREGAARMLVFAGVFDHELTLEIRDGSQGGTSIDAALRMLPTTPAIMWSLIVLALVPGVWITDSMLRAYFGWYDTWEGSTWWWYVPLTLLAAPVVVRQMGAARREAHRAARTQIETLARLVEGELTE